MFWYTNSTLAKLINFLLFCVNPFVSIVSLTIGTLGFLTLLGDVGDLQSIVNNWKENPITEIRFVSSYDCPENFTMLNTTWPGTLDHCDCRAVGKEIRLGNCFPWEPECTQRKGIPPIQMNKWRNQTICVKRYTNESSIERPFPIHCPPERKICGGSTKLASQTIPLAHQIS
jgi:hypothetical protein